MAAPARNQGTLRYIQELKKKHGIHYAGHTSYCFAELPPEPVAAQPGRLAVPAATRPGVPIEKAFFGDTMSFYQ